uniref:Uncharacterized protein n=1 Tax=Populus alba TaxID=43335 RepID=A0A4U5QVR2_POPAL|nr:hypothetical protein D5086_0000035190 [Populus alba]
MTYRRRQATGSSRWSLDDFLNSSSASNVSSPNFADSTSCFEEHPIPRIPKVQQGDDVGGNPSQEDADVNSNPRVLQQVADVSSNPSQEGDDFFSNPRVQKGADVSSNPSREGDDFFSKPRVQNGADVSSNPIQEGDNVFSNPRVQEAPLQRLQETTMSNVCSLTQKISRRRLAITNWEKGGLIGSGSFGSVYKVSNEK